MSEFLIAAACYLLPSALIGLWILADRWLDARHDAENVDALPDADAEWLAVLAATDTPIFAEVWAESLRRDLEEC